MIEIKSRWESVSDRGKWTARGASFMAKIKATKAVWFPPQPAQNGAKAASTAKKTARKTTTKASKKTAAAAKKSPGGAKKVSKSVRRQKA